MCTLIEPKYATSSKRSAVAASLSLLLLAVAAPISAQAADDDWHFSATIYGWFPDIGGHTTLPAGASSVDVDISQILDHLKMTFQGSFEMQKGPWGAFVDVVYLDVGASNSRTRNLSVGGVPIPASITANTDFDLKSTFLTLAGTYRIGSDEKSPFNLLFGARLANMDEVLEWQFTGVFGPIVPPPSIGSRGESVDIWDAVVGAKGRFAFGANGKWGVPYYIDIGTGDSDLTWQGMLGLSYSFNWGEIGAAWNYLDYDLGSDGPIKNLNFSGPALGARFRW
jgi:hypothetical protein